MNEEKEKKPEGHEQDFSESAKHSRPPSGYSGGSSRGRSAGLFMRGCAIAFGVVALVFFFIVGTCFLR